MERNIIDIFEKYDTDKNSKGHNYAPYYQKHLPDTAKKILEVGVHRAESIKMWHEIFPEAKIYGLDLFSEYDPPFQADWVVWIKGSQIDGELLKTVRGYGRFDFCVEDGSHNSIDQWITFHSLIGNCDLYVLEDAHTAKESFYRQGLRFNETMLGQLQQIKYKYNFFIGCQFELYEDKIAFIYAD